MSDVSTVVVERDIDRSQMSVSKTEVAIELIGMSKWFGDFHVLRDINLRVMSGEWLRARPMQARSARFRAPMA